MLFHLILFAKILDVAVTVRDIHVTQQFRHLQSSAIEKVTLHGQVGSNGSMMSQRYYVSRN